MQPYANHRLRKVRTGAAPGGALVGADGVEILIHHRLVPVVLALLEADSIIGGYQGVDSGRVSGHRTGAARLGLFLDVQKGV